VGPRQLSVQMVGTCNCCRLRLIFKLARRFQPQRFLAILAQQATGQSKTPPAILNMSLSPARLG